MKESLSQFYITWSVVGSFCSRDKRMAYYYGSCAISGGCQRAFMSGNSRVHRRYSTKLGRRACVTFARLSVSLVWMLFTTFSGWLIVGCSRGC